jgi:XRE family transcriptional regulator, fatty acid utilization regulator
MAGDAMKYAGSSLQMTQLALGQRIRELREANGWSQAAFAAMCGIDPSYVSRIEQGKINLRCSVLQIIAEQLEISVFSLLENIT